MWSESSSANSVNLMKNLQQLQRYRIFHKDYFWRALYISAGALKMQDVIIAGSDTHRDLTLRDL